MTPLGSLDILLVEDNQDHADFILNTLKDKDGTRTYWVKNGEEALQFLWQRRDTRALVVLLDLHLPKVDGHDVLRQIRREDSLRSIPVVVLTTSDRQEEIDAAYRAGANGYVTKPLTLQEFVDKLHSLKQYWAFTSEIPAPQPQSVSG